MEVIAALLANHRKRVSCLFWPFKKNKAGYGILFHEGQRWRVHRLAWKFTNGRIYRALEILHACDKPACFNPRHLSQGSRRDNVRDMVAKGRARGGKSLGSRHHSAKLSDENVQQIRKLYKMGVVQVALAEQFKVSQPTISALLLRKTWKNVQPPSY